VTRPLSRPPPGSLLPDGVVSEALIAQPQVQAVSFVGSSAVAYSVYRAAAEHGKRVQALGGAKNYLIVLPDAELERSLAALVGACFGCAGQRCVVCPSPRQGQAARPRPRRPARRHPRDRAFETGK
jgi:acyl-CoA reductase-like NAD-dependent aldehyde dehydrogenase